MVVVVEMTNPLGIFDFCTRLKMSPFGHCVLLQLRTPAKGDSKVALTRPKDVSREIEIILA